MATSKLSSLPNHPNANCILLDGEESHSSAHHSLSIRISSRIRSKDLPSPPRQQAHLLPRILAATDGSELALGHLAKQAVP